MTRYVWGSRGVLLGVSPLSTVLCGVSFITFCCWFTVLVACDVEVHPARS